jgi:hypothetical protein
MNNSKKHNFRKELQERQLADALFAAAQLWLKTHPGVPKPKDVLGTAVRIAAATIEANTTVAMPGLRTLPIVPARWSEPADADDWKPAGPAFDHVGCAEAVFEAFPSFISEGKRRRAWFVMLLNDGQHWSFDAIAKDKKVIAASGGRKISRMRVCQIASDGYRSIAAGLGPMIDKAVDRAMAKQVADRAQQTAA